MPDPTPTPWTYHDIRSTLIIPFLPYYFLSVALYAFYLNANLFVLGLVFALGVCVVFVGVAVVFGDGPREGGGEREKKEGEGGGRG